MPQTQDTRPLRPSQAQDLIALAQRIARDSERHALLSASLATQADRLMAAGLKLLQDRAAEHDGVN